MARNVYLMQINENFGGNVFLPYSVASIWSYCAADATIAKSYRLGSLMFLKKPVEDAVAEMDQPDVFGISGYIWNWEYSLAVAEAVKTRYPDCLIVVGGPQVPMRSEGFFKERPHVDILVHFEGEETLAEILRHRLSADGLESYANITGTSVRGPDNETLRAPARERPNDISEFPSPYKDGMFDEIMKLPFSFHAYQETHRGCPYSCTFCDWGSAVYTKVRPFSDDRVLAEIEWFGQHNIEHLLNCDANFGILKRDDKIVDKLIETKLKYGYPKTFLASYAKNAGKKIFAITTRLNQYGLTKGANLSLQSLNDSTLEFIKRKNIALEDFEQTIDAYHAEGVSAVTEIILALPGESYDSFCEGIDRLLLAGQHDSIAIYRCTILQNSEMAAPWYMEEHGLKTVRTPMTMNHGSYPKDGDILEWQDTVISTNAMNLEDFRRAYAFSWVIQTFHCLGLTKTIAIALNRRFGIPYKNFYQALLDIAETKEESLLHRERAWFVEFMDKAISGKGIWHLESSLYGDGINWPPEEIAFLNLIMDKARFYSELKELFAADLGERLGLSDEQEFLSQLIEFQAASVVTPEGAIDKTMALDHDIPHLLADKSANWDSCHDKPVTVQLTSDADCEGDLQRFAREVVWYGRKGGRFLARIDYVNQPAETKDDSTIQAAAF